MWQTPNAAARSTLETIMHESEQRGAVGYQNPFARKMKEMGARAAFLSLASKLFDASVVAELEQIEDLEALEQEIVRRQAAGR